VNMVWHLFSPALDIHPHRNAFAVAVIGSFQKLIRITRLRIQQNLTLYSHKFQAFVELVQTEYPTHSGKRTF